MDFKTYAVKSNLKKITENGGTAYSSTGNELLTLFATIGGARGRSEEEIKKAFIAARKEDKELADSLVLYTRGIRNGGLGERRAGRILINTLAYLDPPKVIRNFNTIVSCGRWDDLFCLFGTPCQHSMLLYIAETLALDFKGFENKQPISLLAKWMPSINTSSVETRKKAKIICKHLNLSEASYRKLLSVLRGYLKVTEKYMSGGRWDEIDFEKVSSLAMNNYSLAFLNHCGEKFKQYIEDVKNEKKKINSSTLYPYDIIKKYYTEGISELDEEAWKNLPDYITGEDDIICMADVSASMFSEGYRPISASIGLATYFAQRNKGAYKRLYMTFSTRPRFIEIDKNMSLSEIVSDIMTVGNSGYSTDLNKAMKAIFDAAIVTYEVPKALVIISDMEIDRYKESSFDIAEKWEMKYKELGLEMPKLILWNVEARHETFLSTKSNSNVAFISGLSPAIFSHFSSLFDKDAYSAMVEILSKEEYQWD